MSETWLLRVADGLARRAAAYGRDIGVAFTVGLLLALAAPHVYAPVTDFERVLVFLLGFVGTGSALGFWLATAKQFDEELRRLKQQKDAGLLPEAVYERLLDRAVSWYAARRFGGALPPAAEPPKPSRPRRPVPPPAPPPPEPPA